MEIFLSWTSPSDNVASALLDNDNREWTAPSQHHDEMTDIVACIHNQHHDQMRNGDTAGDHDTTAARPL